MITSRSDCHNLSHASWHQIVKVFNGCCKIWNCNLFEQLLAQRLSQSGKLAFMKLMQQHTLYPGNLKLWEQIKIQQWMRNSSLLIWLERNNESRSKLNSEWGFILICMHVGDVFFANAIEWCTDHQYQSNPNLTHMMSLHQTHAA